MGRSVTTSPSIILIDGYNLLHKAGLGALLQSHADAARRGVVDLVAGRATAGARMWVVFDGAGEDIPAMEAVRVEYARMRSADDWIRGWLEREPRPGRALVVSSDAAVAAHARALGARVERSEDWLARPSTGLVAEDAGEKPRDTLTDTELQLWLRLFEGR